MSDPIRYDFIYNENYASVEREEHKEGDYVSYEDYARLKAEAVTKDYLITQLKAEVERLQDFNDGLMVMRLQDEKGNLLTFSDYARLKAQVERLTKAGDNLVEVFEKDTPLAEAWEAAKEGKPNA